MDSLRAQRREEALRSRAAQFARSGPHAVEYPLGEGELESRRVELARERIAELPTELSGYFRVRFAQGLSQRQAARHLGLTRRRARTLEQRLLTAVARHLVSRLTSSNRGPTRAGSPAAARVGPSRTPL